MHRRYSSFPAAGLGIALCAMSLAGGEAGFRLRHTMHHLGHHGLHILFAGGAVIVYSVWLAFHIATHGWPQFSWKLS